MKAIVKIKSFYKYNWDSNVPIIMDKKMDEKITITQAKESLVRSGYLLESRLENVLRENGFYEKQTLHI